MQRQLQHSIENKNFKLFRSFFCAINFYHKVNVSIQPNPDSLSTAFRKMRLQTLNQSINEKLRQIKLPICLRRTSGSENYFLFIEKLFRPQNFQPQLHAHKNVLLPKDFFIFHSTLYCFSHDISCFQIDKLFAKFCALRL